MLQRDRNVAPSDAAAAGLGVGAAAATWIATRVESDIGGVQTHVDAVRRALEGLGDEVEVISAFSGDYLMVLVAALVAKVLWSVRPATAGRWHRWWHSRLLRRSIIRFAKQRDDRPVAFYAQCPTSLAISRSVARADDRVVGAVHFAGSEANDMAARGGCRPGDRLDRQIRQFERGALRTADGLLFVSQASVDPVLDEYPELSVLPRRILPNFLDDGWAQGSAAQPLSARYSLVTIGRLEPRKNHRYAIDIIAAAAGYGVNFDLTIVGSGPELGTLQRHAAHLGVADSVTFVGRRSDVRPYLLAAGCYLHTAVNEPFGFALIESMACGLPIAAVPTGGMGEVFFDREHGRYLPGDDAHAAAAQIFEMLSDDEELMRISRRGRDRFTSTFATSVVGRKLEDFICETVPDRLVSGDADHRVAHR